MMTQEHANTAMAKCTAKIDFFEELTARIDRMIDEIEMARHDNVLWQFGEDWTPVDKIDEFWDATETAREGLGTLRWLCDDQLTRERNKVKVLEAYVTRLDGEAIPTEVTATDTDIDGEDGAHCFDCAKYVADVHDMDLGMWVQPAHERGTVNKERREYNDRYYAEFVCRECYDKHYRQCDECGADYHESRCTQDENGNWICENCRDAQADNTQADKAQTDAEEDDFKLYPIDIAIYHGGDILTDEELHDAAAQLSKAITANGNFGEVEIEESYLSVIGDAGGDNKTIWKIVGDLCWRGECCLESYDAEWPHELREMPGDEIDAMLKRMGIDDAEDDATK